MIDPLIRENFERQHSDLKKVEDEHLRIYLESQSLDTEAAHIFFITFQQARDAFRKKLLEKTLQSLSDLDDCSLASCEQMVSFAHSPAVVDLIDEIQKMSREFYVSQINDHFREYIDWCKRCYAALSEELICIEDDP